MRFRLLVIGVLPVLAVFLTLSAIPAFAQIASGSVSGTVQDSQGAVVPGAKVTLLNQAQGSTASEVATSPEGTFVFTPVNPGVYTVTVEATGFKKYEKKEITVHAQDRIGLPPIALEVGAVGESVTVEASAVQLQTVSAERSGIVTGSQIVDLASSGRNFTDLLKTVPGFNSDTQNANGLRSDQNAVAVDGVSNMDTGCNCTGTWRINSDIIAEFKVLTNGQQAEFGRAAGANITIVTKGGTRDFHGGAYLFLRNEWMNANTFINNYNGLSRPRNRNSTEGFNLGGPIFIPGKFNKNRDKLFFFTNWEFQRPRIFNNLTNFTMPTAEQRKGDFSATQENGKPVTIIDPLTRTPFAGNIIPADRINKYGQQILNFYPLPNRLGVDNAYNYQYQFLPTRPANDQTFRVDYNINDKWRFYFRLLHNFTDRTEETSLNINNAIGISPFHAPWGAITGSGNLTTIITPTLTNEFNYGNTRNYLPVDVPSDSRYMRANNGIQAPSLFPDADPLKLMPNLFWDVPNSPNIYFSGLPYDNENPTVNITDNLSKVFATHTMKLGFFMESSFKRQTATEINNGRYYFTRDTANPGDAGWSYATALLGNYQAYDQASKYVKGYFRAKSFEWYAQDNWKLRSNLTLDYGMRFSVIQPMYDEKLQESGFDPTAYDPSQRVTLYRPYCLNGLATCTGANRVSINPLTGVTGPATLIGGIVPNVGNTLNGVVVAGQNGYSKGLIDSRGVHFAPRFGLAWMPGGAAGKTVVRTGGGVFYERIQGNMTFNQIIFPPTLLTPKLYYGSMDTLASASSTLFPLVTAGLAKDGHLPTVYNYNFSVQRELPLHVMLDVGYVGSMSRHLTSRYPFNEVPFGAAWLPQNQDPTKDVTNLSGDNALPSDFLRPYVGFVGTGASVAQSGLGSGGFMATYGGSSNYNSLQISANRRAGNFNFGVVYNYSKVLGTQSAYNELQHPLYDRKANYDVLTFDRTQVLTINYMYTLPSVAKKGSLLGNPVTRTILNGWQVSGITSFSSGAPTAITYGQQGLGATALARRITGNEGWAARPVLTSDPDLSPGDRTIYSWINTSAVKPAAKGSMGMDSNHYQMRGPGINNWDLSIYKQIHFTQEASRYIQLRLEMYNAWNHTQWASINSAATFDANGNLTNLPSALGGGGGRFGFGATNAVGTTGAARGPRSIQAGIKVYF